MDSYLFTSKDASKEKYKNLKKIRVLYLSNMITEKGFLDLLDAIELLPLEVLSKFEFNFVGGFQKISLKKDFIERISKLPCVKYLGKFINGEEKKILYASTHIFCLPTYYPYEGQPISILEAYASGCSVMTTNHAGIPDIFSHNVNGLEIESKSPKSITSCLVSIASDPNKLIDFSLNNMAQANKFNKIDNFKFKISEIFDLDKKEAVL